MRKLGFTICIILLAGLLPGVSAQSPSGTLLFDLDWQLAVDPLHLEFAYPGGWYYEQRGNQIFLAEDEQELSLLTDNDPLTRTRSYSMQMTFIPLDQLGFELRAKLADVQAAVLAQEGLQAMEAIDIPVMGLRAPTMMVSDPQGNSSLISLWLQDGHVVVFQFRLPPGQAITDDVVYTWGYILGSVTPLTGIISLDETHEFAELDGFTLNYPAGWSAEQEVYSGVTYITEQKSDLGEALSGDQFKLDGKMIGFLAQSMDQLGISPDATIQDIADALGISTPGERTEYLLFGEPALGYQAIDAVGDHNITIVGKINNTVFVFLFAAPTEESLDEMRPLMRAVLMSIEDE